MGNPCNEDVREIMHDLMSQVDLLYTEQWEGLLARIIHSPETPLSHWETERILWEATPAERKWIENNLPPNHPLIIKFATEYSVPLNSHTDFSISL